MENTAMETTANENLIAPYFMVLDTETIGLEKRFCYDLGYGIYDRQGNAVVEREFIIDQIWNNKPLFETAYYSTKKELYVSKLRGRTAIMEKWGYACDKMIRDMQAFGVQEIYAYNSSFDASVFDFNVEWFKTRNALDYGTVYDIWGYTSRLIEAGLADDYIEFVIANGLISDSGNIKNNADSWGKFLFNNMEFAEEHTALEDVKLEVLILKECVKRGLPWGANFKPNRTISAGEALTEKTLTIVDKNKKEHYFDYRQITNYKTRNKIILR